MKLKFTSPLLLAFLNVAIHWGHCHYYFLLLLFLLVCRHWALDWIIPAAVFSASRKWMFCSMTPLGLEELGALTLSLYSGCSMMIVTAECKKHWSWEMNSGRSSWQSWRFVHCCIMKKDALMMIVTAECKKHWSWEMNSGRSSWQSWRFVHCCIMKKDALMMIVTAECKKHWSWEMNSGRSSWQSWRFVHCCIMKKDALSLFCFNLIELLRYYERFLSHLSLCVCVCVWCGWGSGWVTLLFICARLVHMHSTVYFYVVENKWIYTVKCQAH